MPDVFDQLDSPATGDVFDQIGGGDVFDSIDTPTASVGVRAGQPVPEMSLTNRAGQFSIAGGKGFVSGAMQLGAGAIRVAETGTGIGPILGYPAANAADKLVGKATAAMDEALPTQDTLPNRIAGGIGAATPLVTATVATGGGAAVPAAMGAAQSLGNSAQDIDARRARGEQISGLQAATAMTGKAIVEGGTEAIGGSVFKRLLPTGTAVQLVGNTAQEAGTEAASQLGSNVIDRGVFGDTKPLSTGVGEAALIGGIMGGGMGAAGVVTQQAGGDVFDQVAATPETKIRFRYTGVDVNGKPTSGVVLADDREGAVAEIRKLNQMPVDVDWATTESNAGDIFDQVDSSSQQQSVQQQTVPADIAAQEAEIDRRDEQLRRQYAQQEQQTQQPVSDSRARDAAIVQSENEEVADRQLRELWQRRQEERFQQENAGVLQDIAAEPARQRARDLEAADEADIEAEVAGEAAKGEPTEYTEEDLQRSNVKKIAADLGVVYDTDALTIPRVLAMQDTRRIALLTDKELYWALKDRGIRQVPAARGDRINALLNFIQQNRQSMPQERRNAGSTRNSAQERNVADGDRAGIADDSGRGGVAQPQDVQAVADSVSPVVGDQGAPAGNIAGDVGQVAPAVGGAAAGGVEPWRMTLAEARDPANWEKVNEVLKQYPQQMHDNLVQSGLSPQKALLEMRAIGKKIGQRIQARNEQQQAEEAAARQKEADEYRANANRPRETREQKIARYDKEIERLTAKLSEVQAKQKATNDLSLIGKISTLKKALGTANKFRYLYQSKPAGWVEDAPASPGTVGQGTATADTPTIEGESSATATPSPVAPQVAAPSGDTKSSSVAQGQSSEVVAPSQQSEVASPSPQSTATAGEGKEAWEMTRQQFSVKINPSNSARPEVSSPTPHSAGKLTVQTLSGPKQVTGRRYWLPNYNGPELFVSSKAPPKGMPERLYSVYVYETGDIITTSTGAGSLEDTLKLAVQRLRAGGDIASSLHRRAIDRAIRQGKPVPASVLADYPDLQKGASDAQAQKATQAEVLSSGYAASPSIEDINSGKAMADRLNAKVDEWIDMGTSGGTKPLDTSWERGAVKRLVAAEFDSLMKGRFGGSIAAAKIAVSKARTFAELKKAIAKIAPVAPTGKGGNGTGTDIPAPTVGEGERGATATPLSQVDDQFVIPGTEESVRQEMSREQMLRAYRNTVGGSTEDARAGIAAMEKAAAEAAAQSNMSMEDVVSATLSPTDGMGDQKLAEQIAGRAVAMFGKRVPKRSWQDSRDRARFDVRSRAAREEVAGLLEESAKQKDEAQRRAQDEAEDTQTTVPVVKTGSFDDLRGTVDSILKQYAELNNKINNLREKQRKSKSASIAKQIEKLEEESQQLRVAAMDARESLRNARLREILETGDEAQKLSARDELNKEAIEAEVQRQTAIERTKELRTDNSELKPSVKHIDRNIIEGGTIVSDGRYAIETKDMKPNALLKRMSEPAKDKRTYPENVAKEMLSDAIKFAKDQKPLTDLGYRNLTKSHGRLERARYFVTPDKTPVMLNADMLATIDKAVGGISEIRVGGPKSSSPVVFYKGKKPIGMMMPVNEIEAIDLETATGKTSPPQPRPTDRGGARTWKGAIHQFGIYGETGAASKTGITFFRGPDFKQIADEMKGTYAYTEQDVSLDNPIVAETKEDVAKKLNFSIPRGTDAVRDAALKKAAEAAGHDGWVLERKIDGTNRTVEIAVFKNIDFGRKPRPTDRGGFIAIPGSGKPAQQPGKNFNLTMETRWDTIRRKVQDEFLPVQRMQEDIARQGGVIGEQSEPYLATELFQGRAADQLRALETEYVQPVVQRMRRAGLTVADIDKYLTALHAPERNAHVAKINPKLPDGGSGMTNAEAAKVVAAVAASGKKADYDYVANSVHTMNEQTRKLQLDAGLITQEQHDAWGNYQKYVPLRTDMENDGMRTGQGFNIRGQESKRATGRTSEADSPLTFSLMQAQEKIIRAEKNRVGLAMLKLVEANPDADLWTINDRPTMQSVNAGTGLVQTTPDPMFQYADNVLAVKRDGKTHLIEFKGEQGKKIAAAMKRLNAAKFNVIVRGVQKALNVYKALQTSYNPDFILPNLVRDLQTAGINIGADKSAKMAAATVKGVPKAWKAAFDVTGNKAAGTNKKYHDAMREYLANGGKVDSYATEGFDETSKEIEKQLREADPNGIDRARILVRGIGNAVDRVNGATETAVRLSAYVQMREAGASPARAASFAKNLTVNFNRKGEWGSVINTLYVFSNASIQGSTRLLKSLTTTKRGAAVAGGIVASGIAYGMTVAAMFGEDEDGRKIWDRIPKHVKDTHLVLPRGGGKFFTIPLPYGYNVLFNAGRSAGEVLAGSETPGSAAFNTVKSAANAFNPLGGEGSALQMLSPTILDPFVQAAENKSWTGQPIVPEQAPFGLQKPDSQLSTRRTSATAKAVAQWLNRATGGDEVTPGKVDISPAMLDHFFEFVVGGTGRTIERAAQLPGKDEIKARDIPVVRRFVGDVPENPNLTEFYRTAKTIEDAYARTKHYLKSGDKDRARSYYKANKVELDMRKYIDEVRDKLKELREIEDRATKQKRPEVVKKARDRMEIEARKFMTVFRRKGGSVPADPG